MLLVVEKMIHRHLDGKFTYDGSQINPNWAFIDHSIKGSSIVTWRGPMYIELENLKDYEDIGLEIKSNESIHFIVEHFDCQPGNLEIAYLRQRLFIMIIAEQLKKCGISSYRNGDDIFINSNNPKDLNDNFNPSKLTVSIATASISSMKIHVGINLTSDGTPNDVDTIGLFDLAIFSEENVIDFVNDIAESYISNINDIKMDIAKTKTY